MNEEVKVEVLPNIQSKCELCRWYLGDRQCPAFEDIIPAEIWAGSHDYALDNQVVDLTYNEIGAAL